MEFQLSRQEAASYLRAIQEHQIPLNREKLTAALAKLGAGTLEAFLELMQEASRVTRRRARGMVLVPSGGGCRRR